VSTVASGIVLFFAILFEFLFLLTLSVSSWDGGERGVTTAGMMQLVVFFGFDGFLFDFFLTSSAPALWNVFLLRFGVIVALLDYHNS